MKTKNKEIKVLKTSENTRETTSPKKNVNTSPNKDASKTFSFIFFHYRKWF